MTSTEGGPAPMTLAQVAALHERGGLSALLRMLGPWLFVGPAPAADGPDWTFRTMSARSLRLRVDGAETMLSEAYLVFGVLKMRPGAFANTLLIGRSTSNDICLPHASISKLHARIRVVSEAEHWLSDAGSSNGTSYDNMDLEAGVEQRMRHGAHARFGAMALQSFATRPFTAMLGELNKQ